MEHIPALAHQSSVPTDVPSPPSLLSASDPPYHTPCHTTLSKLLPRQTVIILRTWVVSATLSSHDKVQLMSKGISMCPRITGSSSHGPVLEALPTLSLLPACTPRLCAACVLTPVLRGAGQRGLEIFQGNSG